MLDGGCTQFGGQFLVHQFACSAVVAEDTDLDQAVGVEGSVDFLAHAGRQAIAANEDDGAEMVGLSAVFAALGRGEFNLGHGPYYRGRTKEA